MSFDSDLLIEDPNGGSWDTVKDYISAISYDQEQKHDFFTWKNVDLKNIDLDEPANPEDALAGLLKTAAALKVTIPYSEGKPLGNDTLGKPWDEIQGAVAPEENLLKENESVMTLEELIVDVYPGLQMGIREIRQQLELAANDPEEFKKQFDKSHEDYRKWLVKALPNAATLVTAVVVALKLAGCSTPSRSVEFVNDNEPIVTLQQTVEAYTPTLEPTATSTFIPTETPTLTPTETQEPTPTVTPTRIPTSEDYWVRGYMLDIAMCTEGWCTSLFVEEATVTNYYLDNDEIVLEVDMLIYEQHMRAEIRSKSFQFKEYSNSTKSFSRPVTITSENFSDLDSLLFDVSSNTRYQVEVTVVGNQTFTDDLVVDYVSGYQDLNFNLAEIVKYEKTR